MAGAPPLVAVNRTERLERLLQSDYRLIWRLLRRLGVPADNAGDATQQEDRERAFAFGTAIRVAQSFRRRAARESLDDASEAHPSMVPGADELSDQKRARELLDRVLGEMSLELRTVFVLFELEGLTSPEIVELVGVPLGTVASRLRRARERFHELVALHGRPSDKSRPAGGRTP
jgi:RNA polymerase sigma-70 factor (ECF subfamily)